MKKGKVTGIEVSCLKGMLSDSVSVEDMARQLDRSASFIRKELVVLQKAVENASLFIKRTASGQDGVAIMTPEGSTRIDNNKTKESTIPRESSRKPWIHKIKGNG